MNDLLLAQELAAVLAAYAELATLYTPAVSEAVPDPVPQIYATQAAAPTLARPTLTIAGEFEPYFHRRKGGLTFEGRSRQGDETADAEHQARFSALYVALFGAQGADKAATLANRDAAKAALKAALALRGKVNVIDYGCAANAITADLDGEDLRTTLSLRIVWEFVPAV